MSRSRRRPHGRRPRSGRAATGPGTRTCPSELHRVELRSAAGPEHVRHLAAHPLWPSPRAPAPSTRSAAGRAWRGNGPARVTPGSPAARSTPRGKPTKTQHVGKVRRVDPSFFTRRSPQFNAFGFARCTVAPRSCNRSTAQYQPYVASITTSGVRTRLRHHRGELDRVVRRHGATPAARPPVRRTITERRR